MDSLMAVELRLALESRLRVDLPLVSLAEGHERRLDRRPARRRSLGGAQGTANGQRLSRVMRGRPTEVRRRSQTRPTASEIADTKQVAAE